LVHSETIVEPLANFKFSCWLHPGRPIYFARHQAGDVAELADGR
jgi:hypothetical protein